MDAIKTTETLLYAPVLSKANDMHTSCIMRYLIEGGAIDKTQDNGSKNGQKNKERIANPSSPISLKIQQKLSWKPQWISPLGYSSVCGTLCTLESPPFLVFQFLSINLDLISYS